MEGGKWSFIKEPEQWSPASDIISETRFHKTLTRGDDALAVPYNETKLLKQ
ncbi:MAG: hypothetical protein M0Z35_11370 [Desulfitobacterium hafniense]|nr:hypothetical protein [Desulfitobacterium hafniense]